MEKKDGKPESGGDAAQARRYTPGEEVANAVVHVIGSHLGAAMIALLVWAALKSGRDVAWKVTSGAVFGSCTILMYAMSTAYHAVSYQPAKRILNILDHMAIYFLIAGTYTPFALVTLRPGHPALAWSLFGIEWGATIAGVCVKAFTTGRFRVLSTLAYIAMGWMAVVGIVPLVRELGPLGTMWLAVGGACYTVGAAFYLWKTLPYHHPVWHAFVLAGTICHFFSIIWYVME